MKRFFIIAAFAAMFCVVACAPQPEVSAPEVEQSADSDEATKAEDENNSQSTNENTASGDSSEAVEPEIQGPEIIGDYECGELPPDKPYIQLFDQETYLLATSCFPNGTADYSSFEKTPENVGWGISIETKSVGDYNSWMAQHDAWNKEHSEVLTNMQTEMVKHSCNGGIYWGNSCDTHYVNGCITNLEITADQTLWGIEPGGNLIDMWEVANANSPILFSYPNGEYVGDIYDISSRCDWYNEEFPEVDWRTELSRCYAPGIIYFKMGEKVFTEKPEMVTYTVKVTFNDEMTYESKFGVRYEYK